jgi:hypothetical protein
MQIEVKFPKQYRPLPQGYKVVWSEESEKYLGMNEEKDIESPVYCSRYMARSWCFTFADKYPNCNRKLINFHQ